MPTILLSLLFSLPSTLFRTFQSLCIMLSSCSRPAITRPARITIVSLNTCSAISFPVALIISTPNIFTLCPSFNLEASERQQLYEIWPYMGSLIIGPCLYIPIYSSSNSSLSKVHLNIDVRMYGSFGPPFLLMKSTNTSQCLTSVYEAWSCVGAWTISLPFDTQWIITVNVVFGNSGRLLLTGLPARSPKSVASRLLARHPFFLAFRISAAISSRNIATHCQRIHSALSKLHNGSQFSNVAKKSVTVVSQCWGPSRTCFHRFCPRIMGWCFFLSHPATHTLIHLLNALPDSFGKLLQGEVRLLQANWRFAFWTARVQLIVALITCIIFIVGHLQQWG